jgi:hypothetical protein
MQIFSLFSCTDTGSIKVDPYWTLEEGGGEGGNFPQVPSLKDPQICKIKKKKFGTFFYINNGVRKNF